MHLLSQGGEGAWPQLPATHASHCVPSSRWLPPSSRPKGCPHSRGTSTALLLPCTSGGALLIESPPQPLCTPAPASWAGHTSVCMYQHLWPHPQTRPPHEHTPGGGSSWRATRVQRASCGGGGHWTMCSWLSPVSSHGQPGTHRWHPPLGRMATWEGGREGGRERGREGVRE